MKHEIYHNAKALISDTAEEVQKVSKTDKGLRHQELNNQLDQQIRQIEHYALTERISRAKADMYIKWLTDYTIKRHEK